MVLTHLWHKPDPISPVTEAASVILFHSSHLTWANRCCQSQWSRLFSSLLFVLRIQPFTYPTIHPSIHCLCPLNPTQACGGYPRCHWAKGWVQPRQVASPSQGFTYNVIWNCYCKIGLFWLIHKALWLNHWSHRNILSGFFPNSLIFAAWFKIQPTPMKKIRGASCGVFLAASTITKVST